MIEAFLQKKFINSTPSFLHQALYYIHSTNDIALKKFANLLNYSERKIVRAFLSSLVLSPKDYMRIVKFRKALNLLNNAACQNLTSISHSCNYYDQSHFIKDIQFFTDNSPKQLRPSLIDVKKEVIFKLD